MEDTSWKIPTDARGRKFLLNIVYSTGSFIFYDNHQLLNDQSILSSLLLTLNVLAMRQVGLSVYSVQCTLILYSVQCISP